MELKIAIIDDEAEARELLRDMLHGQIERIEEADSVAAGVMLVDGFHPDLVFLDIEMADGTGFDLLQKVHFRDFALVFVTAHDEYALKAFRFSAIDYLLKPVGQDELMAAVEKAYAGKKAFHKPKIENLLRQSRDRRFDKLVVNTSDNLYLFDVDEILYLQAKSNYTEIVTEKLRVTVSKTLGFYVDLLSEMGFYRCHHSYLVNLSKIKMFKKQSSLLLLSNDEVVPVSSRKKDVLIDKLVRMR